MKMNITHTESRTTRMRGHLPALALALLVAVGSAPSSQAGIIVFWTGVNGANWSGDGLGGQNWSSTSATPGVPYTPVNGDSLRFFGARPNPSSTNDLTGLSVIAISFQSASANYTLNGNKLSLAGNITFGSSGAHTFNLPLEVTATMSIEGGTGANVLTVNGAITEAGSSRSVNVQSGNVALYGLNSFSATEVSVGIGANNAALYANTLASVGTAQSLGTGARLKLGHGSNNGILIYTGSANAVTDRQLQIGRIDGNYTGSAVVRNNGTGTVTWNGAQYTSAAQPSATKTLTLGGSNTGTNTWAAEIKNNRIADSQALVGLIKADAGKWILSGNNTYDGTTTVSGGTLLINGNQSGATNAVSVQSGAALGGSGTVGGAVTLSLGGVFKPYDTGSGVPSKLTLARVFTYNAGTLDLSALTKIAPGTHVLAEFPSQAVGTFAAFIGLPSGATVGYSATQITLTGPASGSVIAIR